MLIICLAYVTYYISTDEDPGLRIESFAVINLRGVSTNNNIICFIAMQTYKELNCDNTFILTGWWRDRSIRRKLTILTER